MDTNVEIRRYRSEDAPALNEMVKKVFDIEYNVGLWKWKYEDNPRKENCSFVAVAGGHIVAHVGAIIVDLQIRGKQLVGCQLADLMSDPEHRVKGAFSMAYMAMVADVLDKGYRHFGFANTNSTEYVAGSGFAIVGPSVPRLDRLVKITPIIKRRIGSSLISRTIASPVNYVIARLYSRRDPEWKQSAAIEEINEFDERFDALWKKIAVAFPRTLVRSMEYLTWRYMQHPAQQYKVFAFIDSGEIRGYIVLRVMQDEDIKRGLIIDLVTPLDQPKIWRALLKKGVDYLTEEGVAVVTCWMFDHMPYHKALKKLHFIDRPSDLTVMIYGEKGSYDVEFLNDQRNWYVSMGDSDVW